MIELDSAESGAEDFVSMAMCPYISEHDSIVEIARRYNVSKEMAARRLIIEMKRLPAFERVRSNSNN